MPLICFIPIHIVLEGLSHKTVIEYDSSYQRKYNTVIMKFVDECFEKLKVVDKAQKLDIVDLISDLLTRVSKFWLEKIMRPLSQELDLPDRTVCRCCKRNDSVRRCVHDLIIYSHHDNLCTSKVKVDFFAGPPAISINVANQEEVDIERYKRYYSIMVDRYRELPCCRCCPISKSLVHEIEDHIEETETTISLITELIDKSTSNDCEGSACSDEQETNL